MDLDREDWPVVEVEMKHAPALEREANLILGVGVLLVEPVEHRVEAGGLGPHVDHVGGDEAAPGLERVDLGGVGRKDRLGVGGGIDPVFQRPLGKLDAPLGKEGLDLGRVGDLSVFSRNGHDGHRFELLRACEKSRDSGTANYCCCW